jgi:hypothetical protein
MDHDVYVQPHIILYIYIFIYLNFPKVQSIGMTITDKWPDHFDDDQELMDSDVQNLRPRGEQILGRVPSGNLT